MQMRLLRMLMLLLLVGWTAWFVTLHAKLRSTWMQPPSSPGMDESGTASAGEQKLPSNAEALSVVEAPTAAERRVLPADDVGCPKDCHVMAQTELPGDVLRWGADNKVASAAMCCNSCKGFAKCNSWLWCGNETACGGRHLECWLKRHAARRQGG